MSAVIEIEGLRKTFHGPYRSRHVAVDGFDLLVGRGEIHGFLGPNGSGKTTTLRALLGLVRADAGRMRLFGEDVPRRQAHVADRVGAIVETPQFFGNFTGHRTLKLLARAGGVPTRRVDEVLAQVGLHGRGQDEVKGYSLGMRQRLAVASALLKEPELLILDEPANGLDPAGIREMRDLMRDLAAAGVTVLLSSHILGEIQLICDHVTIISAGRRVATGRVEDVLAGHDQHEWRVQVPEPGRAAGLLREAGMAVDERPDHLVVGGAPDGGEISRLLGERGLWVHELVALRPDLESVFLELTGAGRGPGQPGLAYDPAAPDPGEGRLIDLDVTVGANGEAGA